MSSLRNRLISLYSYSDGGSGGFIASTYTLTGSFWGSFQEANSREITLAGGAKQRIDATAVLHLNVTVDLAGVVSPAPGEYYRIVGRTAHRESWEQVLQLARVPDGEVVTVDS